RELPPFTPRYNIAPTADVLTILRGRSGERIARTMRWGLVPGWAKDPAIGARLNNARADTIDEKPAFRGAFRRWRCILPANGFYEWRTPAQPKARKQPFYVHPPDPEGLFAIAGLMERWNGPDGPLYTCCVITTEANAVMTPIHDRMPVLLQPSQFDAWLDPQNEDIAGLKAMLAPAPPEAVVVHPVDPAVNQARNEGAQLIEPVPPQEDPVAARERDGEARHET
ncbi:MAG TPA: SOS response-associated peptidase, partial [Reyranella sp.]|nr:SOS response-associated peptidase [Reyranella sp.]